MMRSFAYWLDDHMPEVFVGWLCVIVIGLAAVGITDVLTTRDDAPCTTVHGNREHR